MFQFIIRCMQSIKKLSDQMGKKKVKPIKRLGMTIHTNNRKQRQVYLKSSKQKNYKQNKAMDVNQKLDIQPPEIVILRLILLQCIYSKSTFYYSFMHFQCEKQIQKQKLDVQTSQENDDNSSVSTVSSLKNNQYKFHCNPQFPQSLVALKNPNQVNGLSNKKIYIWLSKNHQAYYFDLKQILQFLQINMFPIQQIDQVKQIIEKYSENQFQFWCTDKNDIYLLIDLLKEFNIKKSSFVFFNEKMTDQSEELVQFEQQNQFQITIVKHFSQFKKNITFQRLQNNFLLPNLKKEKSNLININYEAMSNQNIDRNLMIDKFKQLSLLNAREYEHEQIQLFNYKTVHPKNYELIIKTYTRESFLYRFLNRLLRSSQNTLQLYYVSVFIQDLNFAIKKLNLIQRVDQTKQNFICYRGAAFSQKQWEYFDNNTGTIVHTLAYLSASLDFKTAQLFATNVILQIHVNDRKDQCNCESDYAFIQQYSVIPQQKQVLFLANSRFKICEIKELLQSGIMLIKLQYVKSCDHWNGKNQNKNEQINSQGQVLNLLKDKALSKKYWLKNMDLVESKIQLIYKDYEHLKQLILLKLKQKLFKLNLKYKIPQTL